MSEPKPLPEMSVEIALEQLVANMPLLVEYEKIRAKQVHARYKALLNVGFDEKQALELCKGLP